MSTPQNNNYRHFLGSLTWKNLAVPEEQFVTPVLSKYAETGGHKTEAEDTPEPRHSRPDNKEEDNIDDDTNIIMAQPPHIHLETFSGKPREKGDIWLRNYSRASKAIYTIPITRYTQLFPSI